MRACLFSPCRTPLSRRRVTSCRAGARNSPLYEREHGSPPENRPCARFAALLVPPLPRRLSPPLPNPPCRRPRRKRTRPTPACKSPCSPAAALGGAAVFQHVKGVSSAVSGYAGGEQKTADYETVEQRRRRPRRKRAERGHQNRPQAACTLTASSLQTSFAVAHEPTQLKPPGARYGHAIPLGDFPAELGQAQAKTATPITSPGSDAAHVFKTTDRRPGPAP